MSMLLALTLPRSMNIQSQEPSGGFIEPSTPALCLCDALQNPWAPTQLWDLGSRTPARKGRRVCIGEDVAMVPSTCDTGMPKGAESFWGGGKRWCLSPPPSGPSAVRAHSAVGFCQCLFCLFPK